MNPIGNNKRGFDHIGTAGSEYCSPHKKNRNNDKENSPNTADNSVTELYDDPTIPTEVCPKSPELNNKSPNRKESKKSFKEFDSPAKGILCFESDGNQIITKSVGGEVIIFPLGEKIGQGAQKSVYRLELQIGSVKKEYAFVKSSKKPFIPEGSIFRPRSINIGGYDMITELADSDGKIMTTWSGEKLIEGFKSITTQLIDLHKKDNYVHKDLKLDNLLIKDEQVSVADFDNKREIESEQHSVTGSFSNIPPLVFSASENNPVESNIAEDVWGLGATVIHALTGYNLYQAYGKDGPINGTTNYKTEKTRLKEKNPLWNEKKLNRETFQVLNSRFKDFYEDKDNGFEAKRDEIYTIIRNQIIKQEKDIHEQQVKILLLDNFWDCINLNPNDRPSLHVIIERLDNLQAALNLKDLKESLTDTSSISSGSI